MHQAVADWETIRLLMPELVIVLAAVYLFVMGMTVASRGWWASFAIGALIIAGVTMWRQESVLWGTVFGDGLAWYEGPLVVDLFGEIVRHLAWAAGMLVALMAYRAAPTRLSPEFLGLVLLAVAGTMVAGRANDLVLLFLALELVSIPTYALLFLGRAGRVSMEATAKYFFLSLLASALLLYGFSFLYGVAGTTEIRQVAGEGGIAAAIGASTSLLIPVAAALVMAGVGFKMAAVPFQFYAPDVYQGTSHANAGFLATLPKVAGVVMLVRLFGLPKATTTPFLWELLALLSMVTITFGNTCALWQKDLRRLMAYSSIAHSGYMLMGVAVLLSMGGGQGFGGMAGTVFYLAVYVPATLGVFAAWTALSGSGSEIRTLEDLNGLGHRRPVLAALSAVFLFSLAGIPPLAGFWGKLSVLGSVLDGGLRWVAGSAADPRGAWLFAMALVGGVNAAVAAAYYLRVVAAMYFQPRHGRAESPVTPSSLGPLAAVVVSAWLVVVFGLMPGVLFQLAHRAEEMVVPVPSVITEQAENGDDDNGPLAASTELLDGRQWEKRHDGAEAAQSSASGTRIRRSGDSYLRGR